MLAYSASAVSPGDFHWCYSSAVTPGEKKFAHCCFSILSLWGLSNTVLLLTVFIKKNLWENVIHVEQSKINIYSPRKSREFKPLNIVLRDLKRCKKEVWWRLPPTPFSSPCFQPLIAHSLERGCGQAMQ